MNKMRPLRDFSATVALLFCRDYRLFPRSNRRFYGVSVDLSPISRFFRLPIGFCLRAKETPLNSARTSKAISFPVGTQFGEQFPEAQQPLPPYYARRRHTFFDPSTKACQPVNCRFPSKIARSKIAAISFLSTVAAPAASTRAFMYSSVL